jgi:glycerophosphoryl diester phosphodiesterase
MDFRTYRHLVAALLWALPSLACAFDVQGHRGARGLAPENTLAGFELALRLGVDTLELDVGLTRDGVVVIHHDRRLNPQVARGPDGQWIAPPGPPLRELSLDQVQAHDVGRLKPDSPYARSYPEQRPVDGERIPTLAALFARVRALEAGGARPVRFNIETKLSPLAPDETADPETLARALLTVIRQHGLQERVSIQSFDWRTLRWVQRLAPGLPLSALTTRLPGGDNVSDAHWTAGLVLAEHGDSVPRLVHALGAGTWSPSWRDLTPALLAEARALGLRVVPWTVNEPEAIERLLEWGVDGLISDYPDRVQQALQRRAASAAGSRR